MKETFSFPSRQIDNYFHYFFQRAFRFAHITAVIKRLDKQLFLKVEPTASMPLRISLDSHKLQAEDCFTRKEIEPVKELQENICFCCGSQNNNSSLYFFGERTSVNTEKQFKTEKRFYFTSLFYFFTCNTIYVYLKNPGFSLQTRSLELQDELYANIQKAESIKVIFTLIHLQQYRIFTYFVKLFMLSEEAQFLKS